MSKLCFVTQKLCFGLRSQKVGGAAVFQSSEEVGSALAIVTVLWRVLVTRRQDKRLSIKGI